jgi:tetratricopeptide (TPR) repeat protein
MEQAQAPGIREILERCDLLIERRRCDQARALLAEAVRAEPDNTELVYRLALVEYLDENEAGAQIAVRQLLRQAPEHYGGRILQAELLEHQKQLGEAEAVWLELLRDYPESANLYAAYAGLMLRTLNLAKAQRLSAEALRLEPGQEGALFVMATVDLIQGRPGDHSRHLETLVREHPENVRTGIALIVALHDRRDGAGALRLARELLRARPTDENLVELVRELTLKYHWSMLPLYPVLRWGWAGAAVLWGVLALGLQALNKVNETATVVIGVSWLLYVLYSWTWPSLLKRFI